MSANEGEKLPAEVEAWIGQPRYEERGEFDVERGYIFTSCASVENGNPVFWDERDDVVPDRGVHSRFAELAQATAPAVLSLQGRQRAERQAWRII